MKVPIYQRKVQRSMKTAAQYLNVPTSASAMAAPGVAVAKLGETMMDWFVQKAELNAKSEAHKAEQTLIGTVDEISRHLLKEEDPTKADQKAKRMFSTAYDRINRDSRILSNSRSKSLFSISGGHVWQTALKEFRKKNDQRIIGHGRGVIEQSTHAQTNVAVQASSKEDRLRAAKRASGPDSYFASGVKQGLYTFQEAITKRKETASKIFQSRFQRKLEAAEDPSMMVRDFEDTIQNDGVLWYTQGAIDRKKMFAGLLTTAVKIETDRRLDEKRETEKATKANQALHRDIFNTKDAVKLVANYLKLKKENYFTPTQLIQVEKIMKARGIGTQYLTTVNTDPSPEQTTSFRTTKQGNDPETITFLHGLDVDNQLSFDAIHNVRVKLTEGSYSNWIGRMTKEKSDGQKAAQTHFKSSFNYEKYKDETNLLGSAPRAAFNKSMTELNEWLRENPRSTHSQIMTKAGEIVTSSRKLYKEILQPQFDALISQMITLLIGIDADKLRKDPLGTISAYIAQKPADQQQSTRNTLSVSIQQFISYKLFGIPE